MPQLRDEEQSELVRLLVAHLGGWSDLDEALSNGGLGRLEHYAPHSATLPQAVRRIVSEFSIRYRVINLVQAVLAHLNQSLPGASCPPIEEWLRTRRDHLEVRVDMDCRVVPDGGPVVVPEEMAYLIDREQQFLWFNLEFEKAQRWEPRQAMVVVICGDRKGAHEQLVRRLLHPEEGLSSFGVRSPRHYRVPYKVHEPGGELFLAQKLCMELKPRHSQARDLAAVLEELAGQHELLAIEVSVGTHELRRTDYSFVSRHLSFWEQVRLPQQLQVIQFICIRTRPRPWYEQLFAWWWPGFDVDRHVAPLLQTKPQLLLMPELALLGRDDVGRWRQRREVEQFFRKAGLFLNESVLDEMFGDHSHHLDDVAERLKNWIDRQVARPSDVTPRHPESVP